MQSSESKKIRSKPYSLNKNKYLLDFEYDRLIHILSSFEDRDFRNVLMLRMALSTGARATELLNLKVKDLDQKSKSVFIYGIKGSNDREIPLEQKFFNHILKFITTNDLEAQAKVFNISYPRLVQIWLNYRPVHKSFHALRHTFAIRLYKKTRDIRLLQFALGHRNIANTMIYADYVYSQEELRKLIL
jgi:site-specific recombinase XerD